MADLGENLRTFLLADATILGLVSTRAAQGVVPQERAQPYLWFELRGTENDDCLDDAVGHVPWKYLFDVECIANDIDTAQALAARVKAIAHLYRGSFGTQNVMGVFVEDHNDEYVPRGAGSDMDGLHVAALSLEIIPQQ